MNRGVTIAISGKSGCGNTTISTMLADKLGLTLVNYTFRSLAEEMGISMAELCKRAEESTQFDRIVDKRQLELGNEGNCVLGSRLAIWLLRSATLKVFLTAPEEVRIQRIANREHTPVEIVARETIERDQKDHNRYLKLYGIDNDSFDFADLVIDTGKHTPEQAVEQIAERLQST